MQKDIERQAHIIDEMQQRIMNLEDKQMELIHYLGKIADILQTHRLI